MRHILFSINPKAKDFNKDEAIEKCKEYLLTIGVQKCAFNGYESKCKCLKFFTEEENEDVLHETAEYMIHWSSLNDKTKREILYQWWRFSLVMPKNYKKRFILPKCLNSNSENDSDDLERVINNARDQKLICRYALLNIINVGKRLWRSSLEGTEKVHGHSGKRGEVTSKGKKFKEGYESLKIFFENLKFSLSKISKSSIKNCGLGNDLKNDSVD